MYEFQLQSGESLPQPHEGIGGVDRTSDYLLSLDEKAVAHRDALIGMADLLHRACLVGNPAPIVQRIYDRITNPQPGDLVVEDSARVSRNPDKRLKGFGYLITRRREWACTDEQWETYKREEVDACERLGMTPSDLDISDRMVEPNAWYVQYGPNSGDVCRWENCGFTVLPVGEIFRARVGTRNPNGSVTLDRDDIVGALADSGIALRPQVSR